MLSSALMGYIKKISNRNIVNIFKTVIEMNDITCNSIFMSMSRG